MKRIYYCFIIKDFSKYEIETTFGSCIVNIIAGIISVNFKLYFFTFNYHCYTKASLYIIKINNSFRYLSYHCNKKEITIDSIHLFDASILKPTNSYLSNFD